MTQRSYRDRTRRTERRLHALYWFGAAAALIAALAPTNARAVEVEGLYQAETIVTGRGEAERLRGFRVGFADVVIKLTGDAASVRSPGARELLSHAGDYVARYAYEDRLKGTPIHDEQGTRERPYYLRMTFDRPAVNRALRAHGLGVWGIDRPRVIVWLGVKDSVRSYVLDRRGEFGYGQREVLRALSNARGVPIVLPAMDATDRRAIGYDDVARANLARLRAAARRYDADAELGGTLVMDARGYWTLTWWLDWRNRVDRHRLENATFDVALRTAVERAAKRFATIARTDRATGADGGRRPQHRR